MLKKPITFTDFDGNTVVKDFYFNITKAELAIAELESDGTWSQTLQKISESNKGSVVMPEFKKILKWTYGERNGDSFDKSDAAYARFENSEPWSELIMELLSDATSAADFINAVLPADIAAKNREAQATNGFRPGADTTRPTPPTITTETPEQMEARIRAELVAQAQTVRTLNPDMTPYPQVSSLQEDQPQTRREALQNEQGIDHTSEPRDPSLG